MLEKYIKEDVIKDTLIVFDTNILLNFYYYDERNLKYLQKFLQDISSYIWEPAHIKNEFENAREKKINEVIKQFKELGKFFKKEDKNVHDFLKEFKRNHMIDIDFFQKYKVDFNFDIQQRYDTQKQYFEECVKRIGTYKNKKQDMLLKALNENIFSKVGEPPKFNINKCLGDYEKFGNYPGKEDSEKDNNKYGDFIIWIAMILKSKEVKKDIIFVTGDQKSDWCNENGSCHDFLLDKFKEETGKRFIFLNFDELISEITIMQNFDILLNFIQGRYFYADTIKNISPYRNKYSYVAIRDIVMKRRKVELYYLSEDKTREWKFLLILRELIDYKFKDLICSGIERYRYALALPIFTYNRFEPCELRYKVVAMYVTPNQKSEKEQLQIIIETADNWYELPRHNYLENINDFFSDKSNEQEKKETNDAYIFNNLKSLFEINDKLF